MNIAIHTATGENARDFAHVHCASWKAAYKDIIPPEELAKFTDPVRCTAMFEKILGAGTGRNLIAYDGDCPCGVCSFGASRDKDLQDAGEVVAIYTLEEYWGKGLGKVLMDAGVEALRAEGFQSILLWVLEENHRARHFYEKYGFVFDGTYKDSGLGNTQEVRYRLT